MTERLDEALARAAVPVMRTSLTDADDLRAGWADAVRALDAHECFGTIALDSDTIEGCKACEAMASFIKAMLGGDDG